MTILDEIEAKLAAAASSHFGMALPADAVEVGQRLRAEQDALANDESTPLEERLQAAFRAFNRAARPWRYLQLFVSGWPTFRDPAVAARVLVEQWSDFEDIPHALFVDLVFPHLSPEALRSAMNAEARMFLDDLPDPFLAWRGQDEGMPPGLSWATDPGTAEVFARGHRGLENPRPAVYRARIAKADVAFACADHSEREVILSRPPAKWKTTTPGVNAPDPAAFDVALREANPPKRGRPTKDDIEQKAAKAEYELRITTAWRSRPDEQPYVQPPPSPPTPKVRSVGRPRDVPGARDLKNDAEHNFAWAVAFWMRDERKRINKQRIPKVNVLKIIRKNMPDVASEFGITPDDLNEDRIYDLAVKSGRVKVLKTKRHTRK